MRCMLAVLVGSGWLEGCSAEVELDEGKLKLMKYGLGL